MRKHNRMANLEDVKHKFREDPKWAFLAEMLAETTVEAPLDGVTANGVLLVNPRLAIHVPSSELVRMARAEFIAARNTSSRPS